MATSPRQMHHHILSFGEDSFGTNCYGCFCTPCMSAETKALLDGRQCTCCDCLCGSCSSDFLFQRRQLRQKYNLNTDVQPGCCGCCSCTPSYVQDVWQPLGLWFGLDAVLSIISATLQIPNLASASACAVIPTVCATNREARMLATRNGSKDTYSGSGAPVPYQGPYKVGMCDCCKDPETCCYVFWCFPCALGSTGAMLQGRECDCCDCMLPPTVWQLRKSTQSKYGMETDNKCEDCVKVTMCPWCMVCQDFAELKLRSSHMHYMPIVQSDPAMMPPGNMEMGSEVAPLMHGGGPSYGASNNKEYSKLSDSQPKI